MGKSVVWFEVTGQDADKLQAFYGSLFDWSFKPMEGMEYGLVECADSQVPGGVGKAPAGPGWVTFYVEVDDIDATIAKATAGGGQVLLPKTQLPDTTIAVLADPEGRAIGISATPAAA